MGWPKKEVAMATERAVSIIYARRTGVHRVVAPSSVLGLYACVQVRLPSSTLRPPPSFFG